MALLMFFTQTDSSWTLHAKTEHHQPWNTEIELEYLGSSNMSDEIASKQQRIPDSAQ